jgi:Zn-dependent peptidase ImmA (M78 family)
MSEKLLALADAEGIEVFEWPFVPPINGFYYCDKSSGPVIGIADRIAEGSALYRCVLAEELGHHFTSTGCILPLGYFSRGQRVKISADEYRAHRWAALELMPGEQVRQALEYGCSNRWELAEYFNVTPELVDFRMELDDMVEFLLHWRPEY